MRGKATFYSCWVLYPRITPAYAGKSAFPIEHIGLVRDHPRVCGEKTKKIP